MKITNHELPKRKFAFVLWWDPHSLPSTEVVRDDELDGLHKSLPMVSAGWVLKEDDAGISIGSEFCGGAEYRNTTHVSRALIVDVRYARVPRPKKVKAVVVPSVEGDVRAAGAH